MNVSFKQPHTPVMIILGGLSGSGKTTLASVLARRLPAVHLRVDAIEQTLLAAKLNPGALGYGIAQALAVENLRHGLCVIADSVNPVAESRKGWRAAAEAADASYLEVKVVCSDIDLHRRRLEARAAKLPGYVLPHQTDMQTVTYAPWDARLVIDMAFLTPDAAADQVIACLTAG